MKPSRTLRRRNFLGMVAGGIVATGALATVSGQARAQSSCSDSDPSDASGNGRKCNRSSGCSDNDSGGNADIAGNGRSCRQPARSGCSDSDSGPQADIAGNGRRCGARAGCTDSDPGEHGDPEGQGRSCPRPSTGCTDSDSADSAGRGRRC